MSVIAFYGNDKIETAQTASMAGIATYLSIEENYKILLINTKYNDTGLQDCFWAQAGNEKPRTHLDTGITGVIKAIASNKTTPEIITNYTKTVFKDRLEILTDNNIPRDTYEKQKEYMKSIIRMANKYYNLVFVDIEGSLEDPYVQEILQESNLIVANTTQRMKALKEFLANRRLCPAINEYNLMFLLGKYDKFSKYNAKNLQRTERLPEVYGIPYNTLFFEACNEGNLADFMINYRKVKQNSVQAPIIESLSEVGQRIIEKLKELQVQV